MANGRLGRKRASRSINCGPLKKKKAFFSATPSPLLHLVVVVVVVAVPRSTPATPPPSIASPLTPSNLWVNGGLSRLVPWLCGGRASGSHVSSAFGCGASLTPTPTSRASVRTRVRRPTTLAVPLMTPLLRRAIDRCRGNLLLHLLRFRGLVGGATAQSLVVPEEQRDPPSDAAVMTFIAPLPDPPPCFDHSPSADSDVHSVPTEHPRSADMAQHPAGLDFTFEPEPVAMLGFAEGDEDWPAFRETTWTPPTIDTSASRQKNLEQT
ncbi:hypothetical protein CYMTET_50655 [Cymbomonas tetramitiformis]|uniref:Uncharacterized protein n=1 Tax=Cymbomonas tetramitiformis TaxID=36881 RepID=A0AAE0ESL2_9CHLO|nr:hypothetical protein CYMTET_50655 [Cymbomonas tetramitiformis]